MSDRMGRKVKWRERDAFIRNDGREHIRNVGRIQDRINTRDDSEGEFRIFRPFPEEGIHTRLIA